jgi:hypothetical protein
MLRHIVASLAIIGSAASCGDHPNAIPLADQTTHRALVSLTTPRADDGGIVVTLKGPDLRTFAAASPSYVIYARPVSANEARIIVIGDIAPGPLFTATFGAAHDLSRYSATIEQVALRSDALIADLTGYQAAPTQPQ